MNKLLIISLSSILSFSLAAQVRGLNQVNRTLQTAGNPPSDVCHSCRVDATPDSLALPTTRPRNGSRSYFNTACRGFINNNGTYGAWGQVIRDEIISKGGGDSLFLSDAIPGMESAPHTCPNWGNLTDNQKVKFWVWTFASIAQVESSCNTTVVNLNSDIDDRSDPPRGLYQLNSLRGNRSWRGTGCSFASNSNNALDHSKCAVGIMEELLKGQDGEYASRTITLRSGVERRTDGRIFPTNSYWQKLRGGGRDGGTGGPIGQLMRQYGPCEATP